jgi:hypothetical protein
VTLETDGGGALPRFPQKRSIFSGITSVRRPSKSARVMA